VCEGDNDLSTKAQHVKDLRRIVIADVQAVLGCSNRSSCVPGAGKDLTILDASSRIRGSRGIPVSSTMGVCKQHIFALMVSGEKAENGKDMLSCWVTTTLLACLLALQGGKQCAGQC
jgi:hypothetical protein